jgi:subtilase family serine protease
MKSILCKMAAGLGLFVLLTIPARAADRHTLSAQVTEAAMHLPMLARLPATNRLQLAIGLPLRDQDTLTNLLHQIYDQRSTNFHRYLTPARFTEQFGPTEQDYQRVMDYVLSNGLDVVATSGNRTLVSVSGSVANIERMFRVHLGVYQHPTENRQFYAPDVPPSVESNVPISHVTGLDNYFIPHPCLRKRGLAFRGSQTDLFNGSGTNNYYLGQDFRNAYVPGVGLAGTGQVIALFEEDGYTPGDISKYAALAGLTNVPLQNVLLPGADGSAGANNGEVALDIEMVLDMAPGISNVVVVEAPLGLPGGEAIMSELAYPTHGEPLANQIGCSWADGGWTNLEPQLVEMATQGQSFFKASGDTGAPAGGIYSGTEDFDYLTTVGGTELSMNGAGVSWSNEVVWDFQFASGASTGEVVPACPIPEYQLGANTTAVGGSSIYRNVPDVAMCADNIEIVDTDLDTNTGNYTLTGTVEPVGGTSAAAPLWAAFTALVNQQAANQNLQPMGFLNPAIYAIGQGPNYNNCFHDITVGNNTNSDSPTLYFAAPGYDLCTGWGSPVGQNLINALVAYSGPIFVDFHYTGSPMNGTINYPFNTLAQGVSAVSNYGTIFIINGGSSPETMTISKPMTITSQNGAATVGN